MRQKREGVRLGEAMKRSGRLLEWIQATGTKAEVARRAGCTRQYVGWLTKHPFGYDAARTVEEKFGMEPMSLESDEGLQLMLTKTHPYAHQDEKEFRQLMRKILASKRDCRGLDDW